MCKVWSCKKDAGVKRVKEFKMYDNPTTEESLRKYINSKIENYNSLSDSQKTVILRKLVCACKSCGLHYSSSYESVPPILNPECKFLFIGRNPNGTEAQNNEVFPYGTKQGGIFRKYLQFLGIGMGEISVLNMCYCYAKGNRPPTQEEISKCICFKKFEMEAITKNVKVIFPMGQDSLKWLYGLNHPGAMQCHGDIYFSELNGKCVMVVPLLHPSHVMIDTELAPEVGNWLKKLRPLIDLVREKEDLHEICEDRL